MSRLIDADAIKIPKVEPDLYEDCSRCKMYSECDFYDFLDQAPTVDLWKYPSRGEYPPSGEEVLCLLWGTTPDVGCWNEKDKLWHFDEFEEEDVDCWQYIIPPQEETTKQCTNCGHYKNNVCERTKTHPNKPEEWTCLDWKEEE